MARPGFVYLILAGILVVQAMASESEHKPSEAMVQIEAESNGLAADQPASSPEAPETMNRRLGKHHSSSDKSVAGGGVIIGGLVTAIFAAVFCYIRVTRKKDSDNGVAGK
ncbi:conserved hypothetical protein [Ricinus communis]|uniref:Transmembrane protein n=1 Tax=Ricinus communis TaxID=3988 RepID=B9S9N4_RICCO|nr:conserved hypothetical protein [Ricinus communis]|eukprot:XP_002522703.1 uncharacterized protein LOC8266918 [Ricinus communis]